MIIFSSDPQLNIPISYHFPNRKITTFNLTSFYSGYIDITDLAKISMYLNQTMHLSMPVFVQSLEFDIQYANIILSTPIMYNAFMQILSSAYEGDIVVILVHRDDYRDAIMESLIKLIQQRYGYNSWIIEDADDIEQVKEETFTPYGLMTLQQDLQRFDESYRDMSNQISVE